MAHHSVWGPSGLIVEQIVRRAAKLTPDEYERLSEAWENEPDSVDTAWGLVSFAVAASGRPAANAADAAADATRDNMATSSRQAALAVADAAYAAAVADMADTGPLKREHIDSIMGPWLQVIGDPRIDPVCECEPPSGTVSDLFTEDGEDPTVVSGPWIAASTDWHGEVTIDLGALAPQPGDRYPWLVMEEDSPEPLIVGYAATSTEALALAEKVDRPVIIWRAGKETR